MKIAVAGAGAMGCRFGGTLFAAGHEVLLLDGWAEHVRAINTSGLRIDDSAGSRLVRVPARSFPAAEPADLVIVFAKATATASVAAAAAGAIGPDTVLLTLQNGLGNIEALRSYVPASRLLAGTTTLGTELLGPGHIRALGTGETVLGAVGSGAGAAHGADGAYAERIGLTLSAAGLPTSVASDVLGVIWAKVAFNCVMNSLCAIASIPVSALALYDDFDTVASSILAEVAAVASAEGVTVNTAASLALMRAQFSPAASGDHLASTLQDLMNGRPTEIAHLNGAIAARAAAHGIEAPLNTLIAQLIGLLEATWPRRVHRLHPDLRARSWAGAVPGPIGSGRCRHRPNHTPTPRSALADSFWGLQGGADGPVGGFQSALGFGLG